MPSYSRSHPSPSSWAALPSEAWQFLEGILDRFEDAWRRGERPALRAYLTEAAAEQRLVLLVQLAHMDLEFRLRAGEAARVEDYLRVYPELHDRPQAVLDLVAAEYLLREARGAAVRLEDYQARFPALAAGLPAVVATCRARSAGANAEAATVPPAKIRPEADTPRPPAVVPLSAAAALPPVQVPGYEVLEVLGEGGMGIVFKSRHLALNRIVALKMIRHATYAGAEERHRFRIEAEAIARLQHPNVVQIFDVGEHAGLPYFSLEFCPGGSLAHQLQGTPLSPHAAAALVEVLARAVHAAHQTGIVHRDLKPANVLLAEDGTPKVTDFGLAKKLHEAGQTASNAIMGTPSYMAPEQAGGKSQQVGPAADVYALGAILYELLTGRPPFKAATTLDTLMQVVADEPVPPRQLQSKTPKDLETICLRCLHKAPQLRYASAWELAEDLRRFRAGEPIQARPVSRGERAWKWVKRRPTLATLVLLCALAALGLVAGGVWHNMRLRTERDRAAKNFELARRAVEEMLTEVGEEQLASEPRMERKRRALLEKARGFYLEFLQDRGNDAALLQATALAHKRVGDIARLLRLDAEAETAYGQAIALLRPLAEASPAKAELRQQLADSHNWHGEVLRLTDRPAEAQQAYEQALRLQRQLVEDFADQPDYRRDQARTLYNLGILARGTNQPQQAREYFAAAIALLEELAAQLPHVPEYQQHLARAYLNQGPVLRRTDGFDQARASYDRATALLQQLQQRHQQLHPKDPYMPEYHHELGATRNNLGILLADAQRYAEAGGAHGQALTIFGRLAADFPAVPDYRKELANTHNSLGIVRMRQHDVSGAQQHFGQARKLFGELAAEFADVVDYQVHLAMILGNLAWLHTEQKDWQAARPLTEEGVQRLQAALKSNPNNRLGRQVLRNQYRSLAETLIELHDHAGAATAALAMPAVLGDQAQDYYYAACFLARCMPLADKDDRLRDRARAVTDHYAGRAVEMLREAIGKGGTGWQRLPEPREAEIFRPLEGREDFRKLRAELPARQSPAGRSAVP
jgi:tetratricopeptide (TPR) repeat protein/tRNA A-37 threonylcarbamoyl transferase component Bud32